MNREQQIEDAAQNHLDRIIREKTAPAEPEPEKWTITLVIESDWDPVQILDESIEIGHQLADTLDGTCDENTVCVRPYGN